MRCLLHGPRWTRILGAACLATATSSCRGYYPTWHYHPREEIHQLHWSADRQQTDARVHVRVVGILRPSQGRPRLLHVRFRAANVGAEPLRFVGTAARVTPAGAQSLAPAAAEDFDVAPGAERSVDLFFALPDPPALANVALLELDVSWTLLEGGRSHESRARFARARGADLDRYAYDDGPDPYRYGPFGYDPWWDSAWGWHRGPWACPPTIVIRQD
jgi:hypothetical protein